MNLADNIKNMDITKSEVTTLMSGIIVALILKLMFKNIESLVMGIFESINITSLPLIIIILSVIAYLLLKYN